MVGDESDENRGLLPRLVEDMFEGGSHAPNPSRPSTPNPYWREAGRRFRIRSRQRRALHRLDCAGATGGTDKASLQISLMEIYNDDVRDLLAGAYNHTRISQA
jgi:hypothetical protein